jgi:hypothetical protein
MKRIVLLFLLVFVAVCAFAAGSKKTDPGLTFTRTGAGLIIGDPFGFVGKLWMGNEVAIDPALAFSSTAKFHIQADYVWHDFKLIEMKNTQDSMAVYYGPGALIRVALDNSFVIGIRGVIGLTYIFKASPFDTFIEIAPSLFLTPNIQMTVLGGLGARFYF